MARQLASDDPVLTRLGDLMPRSEASDPEDVTSAGVYTYFTAETPALGRELWRTTATSAGTALTTDMVPGPGSPSFGTEFFVAGSRMYFAAGPETDDGSDVELWRTNGSGIQRIADIYPGTDRSSRPRDFTAIGDTVYYVATGPQPGGRAIYKTTENGSTTRVGGPSSPSELTALGDGIVFLHDDAVWFSDGTEAGTELVEQFEDVRGALFPFGDHVYFAADSDDEGYDLWRSDGTLAGTTSVRQFDTTGGPFVPATVGTFGGLLYFMAYTDATGFDLWRTAGAGASSREIVDGPGNGRAGSFVTVPFADAVTFTGTTDADGTELYKINGAGAPVMVQDTNPGTQSGVRGDPVVAGDRLYFAGSDGTKAGLYSSTTLTAAGTGLVKEMFNSASLGATTALNVLTMDGAARGASLVFAGYDDNEGSEPWVSDGTGSGTRLLADLNTDGQSSRPLAWAEVGDEVAFAASADRLGQEYHLTDGTAAGTRLVADIVPGRGPGARAVAPIVAVGDSRFYAPSLFGLVVSDGTPATSRLLDVEAPSGDAVAFASRVYYTYGLGFSEGLAVSDGTVAGSRQVFDFDPSGDDDVHGLQVLDDALYFSTHQAGSPEGLWRLSASGDPTLVKALAGKSFLHADSGSRVVQTRTVIGDTLYFAVQNTANDPDDKIELWKSDGTAAGTVLVKTFVEGLGSSFGLFAEWGGRLVFVAGSDDTGEQVWVSDGTEAGTTPISAVEEAEVWDILVHGEEVLFVADEGDGRELYAANGIPAQTRLVKDINPTGSAFEESSFSPNMPRLLAAYDGFVYFAADDGARGSELWRSDGSTSGTQLFREFRPGVLGGAPDNLAALESGLYFGADDGSGVEPWRLALPDTTAPSVGLAGKKKQKQGKKTKIKVRVAVDEAARVSVKGKVTVGKKKYPLTSAPTNLAAGAARTLTLVPKNKKAAKRITQALKKWRKAPKRKQKKLAVKARLSAAGADAAGNTGRATRTVTLT